MGKVRGCAMAWVLHSSIHPGLASLLKHPSILAFCSGVQNGRCPGKDLDPTVHGVEESEHHPQAPTAHLPWPAAIFSFAQAFQVGLFRSSEGVRFTAYPLFKTSPQLPGWCLGMFAFWSQTHIFLWLQQAHSPCGSYAKKGWEGAYKNIQKSFGRHINPCTSSIS